MSFKTSQLISKKFAVIDIGSYKIRVVCYNSYQKGIIISGYAEKRQEFGSFFLGEPEDFESICENIALCLKKAENGEASSEIIVNLLAPQFFLYTHHTNIVRKNSNIPINESEVLQVLHTYEKKYIEEAYKNIKGKSGYLREDMKITFSSIGELSIDGKKLDNPLGKTGKNMKIVLLNIFTPRTYFEITKKIFTAIERPEFKIIPFEYTTLKSVENPDLVIINLGNTKTSIGIKKDAQIVGTTRINIGIGDLIKRIQEQYNITQMEALRGISSDQYQEEKENFLSLFQECIFIGISDIIEKDICPSSFLLLGGGSCNSFVQDFFLRLDLLSLGIKILKPISLIDLPHISNIDNGDFLESLSSFDIYASMINSQQHEKKKNDFLTQKLEYVMQEIEMN